MCQSNDLSKIRPKWLFNESCLADLLLKEIGGYTTLFTSWVKIDYCACLDETDFPLENWFLYFVQIITKLLIFSICIIYYRKQRNVT